MEQLPQNLIAQIYYALFNHPNCKSCRYSYTLGLLLLTPSSYIAIKWTGLVFCVDLVGSYPISQIILGPIYKHSFGNNRMLKNWEQCLNSTTNLSYAALNDVKILKILYHLTLNFNAAFLKALLFLKKILIKSVSIIGEIMGITGITASTLICYTL